jgi:hypothetical protein
LVNTITGVVSGWFVNVAPILYGRVVIRSLNIIAPLGSMFIELGVLVGEKLLLTLEFAKFDKAIPQGT